MVVQEMAPRDSGCLATGVGQRTHAGEGVLDVVSRKPGFGKKLNDRAEQVFNFFVGGRSLAWIAGIGHFGGAHHYHFIPWQNEYRTAIGSFRVQGGGGSPDKSGQNNVRTANAT